MLPTPEIEEDKSELIAQPAKARPLPLIALLGTFQLSLTGNALTQVALPWFVLQTSGSALNTGITAFVGTVPLVLAGFFGGAIIDRIGAKRVSIIADIASGISVLLIPLLHLTVGLEFWQLLILVFFGALLDTPGLTAREALLPEAAGLARARLERANSILETIHGLALLIGPALAGLLISIMGAVNVLWFNAAFFALSVILVAVFIPKEPASERKSGQSYLAEIKEGLGFVFGEPLIRTISLAATYLIFLVTPLYAVILPIYIQRTYADALSLGVLLSVEGGGILLGAILYGVWGHRVSQRWVFVGGILACAASFIVIALLPPFGVLVGASLVVGICSGPLNPLIQTVLQRRTPLALRGRVFGTVMALSLAASPIGVLIAGVLIEEIGIQPTIIGIAAAFMVISLSLLWNKALHGLDER